MEKKGSDELRTKAGQKKTNDRRGEKMKRKQQRLVWDEDKKENDEGQRETCSKWNGMERIKE